MKSTKTIGWACALMFLGGSARADILITNLVEREIWQPGTVAQVQAGTQVPTVSTNITFLNVWNQPANARNNYVDRWHSEVLPATTGDYDFYVAGDNRSLVFLAIDDNPTNKVQIAEETQWAATSTSWLNPGGTSTSIVSQKSSVTFTNASGASPVIGGRSISQGIHLVGGQRYYLEAIREDTGGDDHLGVTMVPHGGGIADGDASTLTGSLIGLVVANPTNLVFTTNPTNQTRYVGMSANFRAVTTTDSVIAPTFQWRRNGINIPNATAAYLSFLVSLADNGAQYDCIATVPGPLVRTSLVAIVTVPATGGMSVTGYVKDEIFSGFTTVSVRTNIETGNVPPPSTVSAVAACDVVASAANYGERIIFFFTPPQSGNYDFYIAADDDADLLVSTSDQPTGLRVVCQEDGYSGRRDWNGTNAANGSISSQKRSDMWSGDGFNTFPNSGGIPLTGGQRYYVELAHRGAGGANFAGATFVSHGTPVADGAPSAFTGSVVSYVTTPVTNFLISAQPASATVTEGQPYTFSVGATTSNSVSEVTPLYQWQKNNIDVPGATGNSLGAFGVLADSGSTFRSIVTIPGLTPLTSSPATLTVQAGQFFAGVLLRNYWNGRVVGDMPTFEAGVPGTFPLPTSTIYVTAMDQNPGTTAGRLFQMSGYFVPSVTTNYIFYLATDDQGDLFLSTDDTPAHKRQIAREDGWSNLRAWAWTAGTGGGGGASTISQKSSFSYTPDGFTFPGNPAGSGISLIAGHRYYIEIDSFNSSGNSACGATFSYLGEPVPVDGSATRLTGDVIGATLPKATTLAITRDLPATQSAFAWRPTYMALTYTNNAVATGLQWYSNGVALPTIYSVSAGTANNVTASMGFVTASHMNNDKWFVVASAPGMTSVTSAVQTLTVLAPFGFVPGALVRERWNQGSTTVGNVEGGVYGPGPVVNNASNVDYNVTGSYAERLSGSFIPPVTTNYVFFLAADDLCDVFLSPDDQPDHKYRIAQEGAWSNFRSWLTVGSAPSSLAQRRSDSYVPNTWPGGAQNGIQLTAGNKYYMEIVHVETGGGDAMCVTYMLGNAGVTDPSFLPFTNGSPSVITSSMLGHMGIPGERVLTSTRSGNTLTISWSPPGGTLVSSPVVSGGTWATVGTANPATVQIGTGNLFLRVSEP